MPSRVYHSLAPSRVSSSHVLLYSPLRMGYNDFRVLRARQLDPRKRGSPLLGFLPFSHHDDENEVQAGLIASPHRLRYFTALSAYSLAFASSDRSSPAVSVGLCLHAFFYRVPMDVTFHPVQIVASSESREPVLRPPPVSKQWPTLLWCCLGL